MVRGQILTALSLSYLGLLGSQFSASSYSMPIPINMSSMNHSQDVKKVKVGQKY